MAGGAAILGGSNYVYSEAHGGFINDKHRRIAEIINEFDPTIEVMWIPRDRRGPGDKAYALRHQLPGKAPYLIKVYDEEEFDERVLAELFEMAAAANGPLTVAQRVEMHDLAVKAVRMSKERELLEEARDEAEFFWRTPLHTVRLGKGRKVNL